MFVNLYGSCSFCFEVVVLGKFKGRAKVADDEVIMVQGSMR